MSPLLSDLKNIRIEDYSYELPDEKIAKFPLPDRDASRLLCYTDGEITTGQFTDVKQILKPGQTLIFNNTKVIYARLFFRKSSGSLIEVFCLEPAIPADYAQNFAEHDCCTWYCMVGNLKKWREEPITATFIHEGTTCHLQAEKIEMSGGTVTVRFSWDKSISFSEVLECCGRIPIPPYLNRDSQETDKVRYQTVYSKEEGSVAAPTAGLHFSETLLASLRENGITIRELTLHVGAGTFRPVKADRIGGHDMHSEHIVVNRELVNALLHKTNDIIAVGTTSIRTLESLYWMGVKRLAGDADFYRISQWEVYSLPAQYTLREAMTALLDWFDLCGEELFKATTTIIIVPGYRFRVIDAMFTNFHQPQSTLLLLVAAAIGDDWRRVYDFALANNFRFLSYGDSSLLKIK